jgi:hypothetical protein
MDDRTFDQVVEELIKAFGAGRQDAAVLHVDPNKQWIRFPLRDGSSHTIQRAHLSSLGTNPGVIADAAYARYLEVFKSL